jgi:Cu/Ag efflux protein CusF
MRKRMLIGAALVAGALGLNQAWAQQQDAGQAAEEDMQATGMVTEADEQTKEITIEDEKFVMPEESGGASMFPQVGAEITVFYREEGGQKVITRIGQAQD